eukprot:gene32338-39108_t
MEFDLYSIVSVAVIGYFFYWWLGVTKRVSGAVNVAGYTIIGSLMDFQVHNMLQSMERYRRIYGKVFMVRFFYQRVFVISDAKLAREVLMMRPKQFRRKAGYASDAVGLSKGLVHANGAVWSRLRRATAPAFSNKNAANIVEDVLPEVNVWIERLRHKASSQDPINMAQEAFTLTVKVISSAAFGLGEDNPVCSYFFSPGFLKDIRCLFKFMMEFASHRLPPWIWRLSPWYHYELEAKDVTHRIAVHCQEVLDFKRSQQTALPERRAMIDTLLERNTKET